MINSILLVIIITVILDSFENKSNFNSQYIIPIIAVLLVKYLLGDWDIGYKWSINDIFFWVILPVISFALINLKK